MVGSRSRMGTRAPSSLSERKSPLNRSRILPDIKTSGEPDAGDPKAVPGGSLWADSSSRLS
jgi:hypothetical protein